MDRRRFVATLGGLAVAWKVNMFEATANAAKGPVIVEAGRRVDAPGAETERFPPANVEEVRKRIQEFLNHEKPSAFVSSAACGADLLALEVAGGLHIKRYVLLPSSVEAFRKGSVTDRPGDWGPLYDQVINSSTVKLLEPAGQPGRLPENQPGTAERGRNSGAQEPHVNDSVGRLEQTIARRRRCYRPFFGAGQVAENPGGRNFDALSRREYGRWWFLWQILLPYVQALRVVEQGHEAEVHVQLLVAVKQGHAGIVGHEVDFGFLVSAEHYDILHDA